MAIMNTGGGMLPNQPRLPNTGGNLQPNQVPAAPPTAAQAPSYSLQNYFGTGTPSPFAGRNYNDMVSSSLEAFTNPNSQLMQQAAQQGLNVANTRGGINSSIAAGASQRAALEQAAPLAQTAVAAQLNQEQAQLQNWVDTQGFNRELNAMPYQNSLAMLNRITEAGIQDPQLYSPSVISGFSNFFNQNMNDILGRYFGNGT